MPRKKVLHLSSVHQTFDNRVFRKECRSLAAAGFEVVLVTPHCEDAVVDGVRIRALPERRGRLRRLLRTVPELLQAAFEERADLYHFHDPELIPAALLLRMRGKRVIYDIHEDYTSSIRQKPHLPAWLRGALARLLGALESLAARAFTQVIAEKYYARRFPTALAVLNYPAVADCRFPKPRPPQAGSPPRLIYTGNITVERGARIAPAILAGHPSAELHMIGRVGHSPGVAAGLAAEMRAIAGPGAGRLTMEGEHGFVPHERMLELYDAGGWTAGLALFPPDEHYREKELTKFFEYMAAGIPILCSDFPVWRELVEGNGVGICVDPGDGAAILAAIDGLAADRQLCLGMGERGQALVRRRFNWETQADMLAALYRRLLRPTHL